MDSFASALREGVVLLDGGFATQLEARGHDLSDSLWSARLLLDEPDEIRATHADFFAAGAQVAITASYQVSETGFVAAGRSAAEAREALTRSVRLAREAASGCDGQRWVAASVGPYGASLADGSEYRGDYGLSVAKLRQWHRPRLTALAEAEPDLLACETIPCLAEVEALVTELSELDLPAWISLTLVGDRTRLGESADEAYAMAAEVPQVVALGANCCDPGGAADVVKAVAGRRPVVFYPNSGEAWNARSRTWTGAAAASTSVRAWLDAGVRAVGGCCRVTPDQIAAMRLQLDERG